MKKKLTISIFLYFILITSGMSQLGLNVENDAKISGKLGIGISSASSKIHIDGGTDVNAVEGGFIITGALDAVNLGIDNNEIQARNNGVKSAISINFEGGNVLLGGPTNSERLFVRDNGDVGIGTLTPKSKFHLTTHQAEFARFENSSSTSSSNWIGFYDGDVRKGILWKRGDDMALLSNIGGIKFYSNGFSTTPDMSILKNGTVSIGLSTSANARLAVEADDTSNLPYSIHAWNDRKSSCVGINGRAANIGDGYRYGVYGRANWGSSSQIGVFGSVGGSGATSCYGVYGRVDATGNSKWAMYAAGNFYHTGSFTSTSDARLKKKIKSIEDVLEKVMKLQPKAYQFKTNEYDYVNLARGQQVGFLSQDVEKIFPDLVEEAEHSFIIHDEKVPLEEQEEKKLVIKSLNYLSFIPILTKAIQEQQQIIEAKEKRIIAVEQENQSLNDRLTQLESAVEKLLNAPSGNEQTGIVNPRPFLQQNQPNPFSKNTKIQYFVPQHVQQAQLQITTTDGKVIKTFTLQKGNNSIHIDARQLAAGSYFYTLIVDGQTIESKQMILTDY